MNYLKDRHYYIDLFDKITVEKCRRMEKSFNPKRSSSDPKDKVRYQWEKVCAGVMMSFVTGEQYARKEQAITEWMKRDEQRDEFLNNTELSIEPGCLNCGKQLDFEDKHLYGSDDDRVWFFFSCPNCKKKRAFFDDGEEFIPKKPKCGKCGVLLKESVRREGKKLTIIRHCGSCGFDDDFVYDDEEEKLDPNFEKDRARFCLSEEEGKKYLDFRFKLEGLKPLLDEIENREKNKSLYDQVEKIEKLTVTQLRNFLVPELKKAGYSSLFFAEPKIEKNVILNFKVEDIKNGRVEYDSKNILKKLLNKVLSNTNWNLMTNGPDYRLGVLNGQLKGLESEEDLLNKVRKRKFPKS